MISDIISDAECEIKRYLKEMPTVYSDLESDISDLLNHMEKVRIVLDTPPEK